jgi:hypothetical protein
MWYSEGYLRDSGHVESGCVGIDGVHGLSLAELLSVLRKIQYQNLHKINMSVRYLAASSGWRVAGVYLTLREIVFLAVISILDFIEAGVHLVGYNPAVENNQDLHGIYHVQVLPSQNPFSREHI